MTNISKLHWSFFENDCIVICETSKEAEGMKVSICTISKLFSLLDGHVEKMKRHNGFNTLNLFVVIIGEIEKKGHG